ncbi:MAG: amino acid adenylation domain-containing protein [bacterium]|nr:amino acid adenylation domain-containing protein [bacterium]
MKEQTPEALAERLRSLPPEKRKLLELRMKNLDIEGARSALPDESAQTFPIVPVPRDGELPPSFSQLREWFLDQLEPGNPAYHIPAALRLRGSLEPAQLVASVNEIVRRHESLRTRFPAADGQPVQVIVPRIEVTMPLVDLGALAPERRETAAEGLAIVEALRSFDLVRGPLVRISLLRLGPRDHVVCLTMHHIVSDGWSMGILIREMLELYAAFREGRPSPLPELAVQYADFAVAQHNFLQGETLERMVSYWQERLGDPPPVLELHADRPRSGWVAAGSATWPLLLDAAFTRRIKSLSQRHGTSLFMTMLGAFKALLRRYTGQEDLCVGTFIAGRNRPEIEPLIGFFINTLALRTDLRGDPSVEELLRRVQKVTVGAYDHQDLPFERLLDALRIERSLSHTPLFQVMLVLQNLPRATVELEGLSFSPFGSAKAQSNFELSLWLSEAGDGLDGYLEYNPQLFDTTTIRRLSRHFLTLLEEVLAAPEQTISTLALLSGGERQQLLGEWSTTPRTVRYSSCFRELFEAQVERSPKATALIDPTTDEELSYEELDHRANRLAQHLAERGSAREAVSPEVRVGLLLERSCDLVVGLLGILKAGGAYVPLDPSYPRERLALILEDAGLTLLLTHRGLDGDLPELGERAPEVIALDRDGERIATCSSESPAAEVPGESAAYVIYTSGSTGLPKGVVVSQRSLAWYAAAAIEHYELVPEDRVLQFSSISFDNSVEEIFPCLARGAALVLRTEEMLGSMAEFFRRCRERSITALSPPTAFWNELVAGAAAEPESWPPSLRILCVGGERMHPEQVAGWRRAVGRKARLMNTYGPTEATVVATLGELTWEDGGDDTPVGPSIGRPVPNARVAILDRYLREVPLGVAGELCIGGDGVARGYLGRPAATAERFIPDPGAAGRRIYRTGDLARFLADGNLEFLGRIDHQVKIRGFRIEPGEIEALLGKHSDVEEAVVVAREDQAGVSKLVAYVMPREATAELRIDEVREFLAAALPEYMVPAAFVVLDELPRTPSGKVDRRSLPVPEEDRTEEDVGYVAPRDETEEVVAEIFAEVLGVERVGVTDNFFELGGHSLLATRLITRVRNAFEVDLPVRDFFAAPTVARLAVVIGNLIIKQLEELSDEEIAQLSQEA